MLKKIMRAFTNADIDGMRIIGNPAVVFVFKSDEKLPLHEKMCDIAREERLPVTVFAKHIKENEFDIRYFFPNGVEVNFCGHGTIVASNVVKDCFNVGNNIIFYFNKEMFLDKRACNKIEVNILTNNFFNMEISRYNIKHVKNSNFIKMILNSFDNLKVDSIKGIFKCKELDDYIVQLNQEANLNSLKVNKNKFEELNSIFKFRACAVTRQSKFSRIDYEARIFSIELTDYEDIVCGSSSCYLSTLWGNELNKDNLTVLFPYNNANEYFGGVEYFEIKNNNKLTLGGYCRN